MTHQPPSVATPFTWRRLIPIFVFIAGLVVFFALGLERYLSIDALRQHPGHGLAYSALLVTDPELEPVEVRHGALRGSARRSRASAREIDQRRSQ